jgi:hypothetical protein
MENNAVLIQEDSAEALIERLLDAADLDFRCCGQGACNAVAAN